MRIDEVYVECRNALESIQPTLMVNSDDEHTLARAEEESRSRKLAAG